MIYLIFGENTYFAFNKIRQIKAEFFKKGGQPFFISEIDGETQNQDFGRIAETIQTRSLFMDAKTQKRLAIFKNVIGAYKEAVAFFEENTELMNGNGEIFVFWERSLTKKDGAFSFFQKHAEKIQEVKNLSSKELDSWLQTKGKDVGLKLSADERAVMISEAGAGAEWALENMLEKALISAPAAGTKISLTPSRPLFKEFDGGTARPRLEISSPAAGAGSPFPFIEKIFSASTGRALIALKEAVLAGHDPQKLIYPFLWKIKQKKRPELYWSGILTESAMRKDPKNAYEHLERLIFVLNPKS